MRYQLVDGKKEGPATIWHEGGSIALLESYRGGELDGPWEARDEQGGFLAEGYADSATGLSVETIYSPGGRRARRVWRLDGLEQGITTIWHGNDRPARQGRFERGKRVGEWRFWNDEGALERIEIYEEGQLVDTRGAEHD
jgi:antitoxin component YwqK of YwqJK toxin-antitoxin module